MIVLSDDARRDAGKVLNLLDVLVGFVVYFYRPALKVQRPHGSLGKDVFRHVGDQDLDGAIGQGYLDYA